MEGQSINQLVLITPSQELRMRPKLAQSDSFSQDTLTWVNSSKGIWAIAFRIKGNRLWKAKTANSYPSDGTVFLPLCSLGDNKLVFIQDPIYFPPTSLVGPGFPTWSHTTWAYCFFHRHINISGSLNSSSHGVVWVLFSLKPASGGWFSHMKYGDQRDFRHHFWYALLKARYSRPSQNHKTLKTKSSFVSTSCLMQALMPGGSSSAF